MTVQDKIRRSALEKYIKYLKCELQRLNDGGMYGTRLSILDFEPEPPIKDGFEPEELKEIEYLFEKLKDVEKLKNFCERNEIEMNK
jgi:hypothetical protein